ncbi:glycosyltransferase family 2 protein [Candidatus Electrothrix laxa]
MENEEKQVVNVIIASYNSAKTLQGCLDSIYVQTYPAIRIIIIDGGSTDSTVNILKNNESRLTYWESEKDRGIYHAWNKALLHTSGEWVCFLGSDDCWAYPDAISDMIFKGNNEHSDIVSGREAQVNERHVVKKIKGIPWSWQSLQRFHSIAHPGMMHRRKIFDSYGNYNEKYKIAGDYDFTLRLGPSVKSSFVDKALVFTGDSGISRTNIQQSLRECRQIQEKHPEIGFKKALLNYYINKVVIYTKIILKIF